MSIFKLYNKIDNVAKPYCFKKIDDNHIWYFNIGYCYESNFNFSMDIRVDLPPIAHGPTFYFNLEDFNTNFKFLAETSHPFFGKLWQLFVKDDALYLQFKIALKPYYLPQSNLSLSQVKPKKMEVQLLNKVELVLLRRHLENIKN